ncbi:glycosyltransferase family 2 protein [Formosa sediminum]|uniref:Glycosyltransferase family 2 protein n=1 Tax=Formosa sediminum TaxID=2594004 RepID=A0A516GM41_9FLAO|nr:glycosyltransferase family 2 protein [Formosa sediminum]QDO92545.1 glycosyltransferase family 2 protein [Formosa sediminum]
MLSVLIPIYNYNVVALVKALHKQLIEANIIFEIICLDDASDVKYMNTNTEVEALSCTSFLKSSHNNGRTQTRQSLCEASQFEWLLFLDADTIPVNTNYILTYIKYINSDFEAIFGGFAYNNTPPENEFMLRWKYGRSKEVVDASVRNRTPYKVIISANFLIKKSVFKSLNAQMQYSGYGLDNYFGALLKDKSIKVYHINNPVYHLGIENSNVYLQKKEAAALMLLKLTKQQKIKTHNNSLLALFTSLKHTKLNVIFSYIHSIFKVQMKRNLLGSNPNIKVLQLYRITFMCYIDFNS